MFKKITIMCLTALFFAVSMPALSTEQSTIALSETNSTFEEKNYDLFSNENNVDVIPYEILTAEVMCKLPERDWLGTESAQKCVYIYFRNCFISRSAEENSLLCHTSDVNVNSYFSNPETKKSDEFIRTVLAKANKLSNIIDSQSLLSAHPTEVNIDRAFTNVKDVCNAIYPAKMNALGVQGYLECVGQLAEAIFSGAKASNGEAQLCLAQMLPPNVRVYCEKKAKELFASQDAKYLKILTSMKKKEQYEYMNSTGLPAKVKIKEMVSAGERKIENLQTICKKFPGILNIKDEMFIPRCNEYAKSTLDHVTGGLASADIAANESTTVLTKVYEAYVPIKGCHNLRKGLIEPYITDQEMSAVEAVKVNAEKTLIANGANQEQAWKKANSGINAQVLTSSKSNYSRQTHQTCRAVLMLFPK